jgi:hypothetical protein
MGKGKKGKEGKIRDGSEGWDKRNEEGGGGGKRHWERSEFALSTAHSSLFFTESLNCSVMVQETYSWGLLNLIYIPPLSNVTAFLW